METYRCEGVWEAKERNAGVRGKGGQKEEGLEEISRGTGTAGREIDECERKQKTTRGKKGNHARRKK